MNHLTVTEVAFLVGADGSHSICRMQVPESERRHYFREYPFTWFGIPAADRGTEFRRQLHRRSTYLAEACTGWPGER